MQSRTSSPALSLPGITETKHWESSVEVDTPGQAKDNTMVRRIRRSSVRGLSRPGVGRGAFVVVVSDSRFA